MDGAREKILQQVEKGLLKQEQADRMLAAVNAIAPLPAATAPPASAPSIVATAERRHTLHPTGTLSIVNPVGDVEVTAHPGEQIDIQVHLKACGDSPEEASARLEAMSLDCSDDAVCVQASATGGQAARLCVRLPASQSVRVEAERIRLQGLKAQAECTSATDITALDCDGELALKSENGDVLLERVRGTVQVHAGNGSVSSRGGCGALEVVCISGSTGVESFEGDLAVRAANGGLRVQGLRGSLAARLGTGAACLHDVRGSVDVRVQSGSVEARLVPQQDSPVRVETRVGDVLLHLPGDTRAELALRARGGRVHGVPPLEGAEKVEGWTRVILGGAADTIIRAESGQGSIVVERSEPAPQDLPLPGIDTVS